MILGLLILTSLLCLTKGETVCYDELGCFTNDPPFGNTPERDIDDLPDDPKIIGTKFYLYNRKSNKSAKIESTRTGEFDPSKKSKLIVHGWFDNGKNPWIQQTKNAILAVEDVNVIVVDWKNGAEDIYFASAVNTQVVGAEIARLVNSLEEKQGANPGDFHCIGHSFGAHTCGYAGKRINGLGRITGLDPAGPLFINVSSLVRLDSLDAQYVDVIHTDGSTDDHIGCGVYEPIGDVDYYPNGGAGQPGCDDPVLSLDRFIFSTESNYTETDTINETMGIVCSHSAAYRYFISSIVNPCDLTSYGCSSYDDFLNGKCFSCEGNACNLMGYHSTPQKRNGSMFLFTRSPAHVNVCPQTYLANLTSDTSSGLFAFGTFQITIETASGKKREALLDDNKSLFLPGLTTSKLFFVKPFEEQIENIRVDYKRFNI